jgi:2-C-methyl-D-erythritol 2,4-cyclodiphosphate synthase
LQTSFDLTCEGGYSVINADCVLVGQEPRIADRRAELEQALSRVVEAPVTVRATTTDGLGFTGRREGLAAYAVALVESTG